MGVQQNPMLQKERPVQFDLRSGPEVSVFMGRINPALASCQVVSERGSHGGFRSAYLEA
jgi:hypothetical protein